MPCFGYYYKSDLLDARPLGVPLHCVSVSANSETGLILGYVEYFGIHRIVVCLGRSYAGPFVSMSYAIDPRSGDQIEVKIDLPFFAADIEAIYNYELIPEGANAHAAAMVLSDALKHRFDQERDRVTREAVEYAFANCGAKQPTSADGAPL